MDPYESAYLQFMYQSLLYTMGFHTTPPVFKHTIAEVVTELERVYYETYRTKVVAVYTLTTSIELWFYYERAGIEGRREQLMVAEGLKQTRKEIKDVCGRYKDVERARKGEARARRNADKGAGVSGGDSQDRPVDAAANGCTDDPGKEGAHHGK